MLSDLTGAAVSKAETAAWLLESFCIVAVNVYMFISGYFLCTSSFKVSRLIQLWLQIWAYSVGVGLIGALTGVLQETAFDTHYLLTLLFPVTMGHYWFMTAYVFLYLLLPFVGMAVKKMTKGQMQAALGILLLAFCVSKSILPVQLEMDRQGYDCLWYLCVFVAAAYVRRFGSAFLERKGRGLLLYAGAACWFSAGLLRCGRCICAPAGWNGGSRCAWSTIMYCLFWRRRDCSGLSAECGCGAGRRTWSTG